jgi:hypothetical protein
MFPFRTFRNLLQAPDEAGTRSTAMKSLTWLTSLLILGLLGSASHYTGMPEWVPMVFAVLLGLDALGFLLAFAYFARKDPSSLRSEGYHLRMRLIEHGSYGDKQQGLINLPTPPRLIESAGGEEGDEAEEGEARERRQP